MATATPVDDPTVPYTEVSIDGKTYKLAVTYRALAIAEHLLKQAGHDINLLYAKLSPSLAGLRSQFVAALHHYHPDVTFEQAEAMVNDANLPRIFLALQKADQLARPKPSPDPLAPGGEAQK